MARRRRAAGDNARAVKTNAQLRKERQEELYEQAAKVGVEPARLPPNVVPFVPRRRP